MSMINRREPLYIEDVQASYVLHEGIVDIFVVTVNNNQYGHRHYIKSLQPGTVFFGGRINIDERDFIMVAVPSEAVARVETDLSCTISPDELAERQKMLETYAQDCIDFEQKAINISRQKAKNEAYTIHTSLSEFLKITDPGAEESIEDSAFVNPLYKAAELVCKFGHIQLVSREELSNLNEAADEVDYLAKVSQLNIREVLLEGNWWREDNGAILGYMNEDGRPVALIPQNPGSYKLHDVARGRSMKLDEKLAGELKPQGVMFYRPFPHQVLNLMDILKFGAQGVWRRDFINVGVMALVGAVIGLLVPYVTQKIFDVYIPGGETDQLMQIGLLLLGFLIGQGLFQLTRDLSMLRIEGKMEGSLQTAVWDRLLSLPAGFFKDYTSGELAMRALGIAQIRQMISGVFVSTIITGVFSLVYLFQVYSYGEDLAVSAVVMVLILLLIGYISGKIQMKYEGEYLTLTNKTSGLVLQLFNAVAKFRVAGAENAAFNQWANLFTQSRKINFRKEMITGIMNTVIAIAPLVFSLVFFIKEVNLETPMQAGAFIAFTTAFGSLSQGMMSTIQTVIQINAIKPMYEMSKPILSTLPEYDEMKANPGKLQGNIRVSHLNFRYSEEGPLILQDISLDIKAGEYVALVGASGSGKSTLFRMLLGFETPESGQVYYDDKDIALVNVKDVRRQLGVVLQNGQLMSGDIFTNIIGGNTKLKLEDARRAAEMAGLTDDIAQMPMGMHTVIAEGAGTLSGGQKQRILIARAIVHNPRILYFDEATSALDNKTQSRVSTSINELDCTRVVIAQRLSTVVNCDRIIVMDKGRIVEMGAYQELIAKGGLFASLAKRQLA